MRGLTLTNPGFVAVAGGGGGGGSGIIYGTAIFGQVIDDPDRYASFVDTTVFPGSGKLTINKPGAMSSIQYFTNTILSFYYGTFGDIVISSTGINGITALSITIGSTTLNGTFVDAGFEGGYMSFTGNQFNVVAQVGDSLEFAVNAAPPATPIEFTNGAIDCYYSGNEYGFIQGSFGAATFSNNITLSGFWYDTATTTTYVEFVNGAYPNGIIVSDTTINTSTTLQITDSNSTIATSVSAQEHAGGVRFTFTGDPFGLEAAGPAFGYVVISNMSYLGTPTTTYSQAGNWETASWSDQGSSFDFQIQLDVAPDSAFLTALNALNPGSFMKWTSSGSTPDSGYAVVQSVSGWPFSGGSFVVISTNIPTYTFTPYFTIDSISLPS